MSLELVRLSKTYTAAKQEDEVEVLRNINYRIEDGEFISIIGPSGCGKTTLLQIISGLEESTSGKVILDGNDIVAPVENIGLIFQEYALLPWRSTLKNIEFGLETKGLPKAKRKAAALEYVRAFGLAGFENKYPHELSGGMQQRVAIARTLITRPKVVLMDEPFGSLDSPTRDSLQRFLLSILENLAETVLFVTHNIDEALFLSDKIIALSKRPAEIIKVFDVPFPHYRDRTSLEYNQYLKDIVEFMGNQTQ